MSTKHFAPEASGSTGTGDVRPKTALLSAFDKTGLDELARALVAVDCDLVASGGTAAALSKAGRPVATIEDYVGLAPAFGGRVKTLHPKVYAGILARRDVPDDLEELERCGARAIDLVYVNLYPFEEVAARGAPLAERIEKIDIGGPSMIRAAAKNWESVAVVCDPADLPALVAELESDGGIARETRRRLAQKAFARTSAYDAAITVNLEDDDAESEKWPVRIERGFVRVSELRYGENPHQAAAVYRATDAPESGSLRAVAGAALSYNNWIDLAAAADLVQSFEECTVALIKHTNPCGVGRGADAAEAFRRALSCDPVSAFGGIAAFNRPLDGDAADALASHFLEVIVAPRITEAAKKRLAKKKKLRLVELAPRAFERAHSEKRSVLGDYLLVQEGLGGGGDARAWKTMSEREPTAAERADLEFAWKVVCHVKSNAIVLAKEGRVVGVGAGQMSRVDSVRIALAKATELGHDVRGAALASDAFFPFPDGPRLALEAGATSLVQPGGSKRDDETIAAVDELGAAQLFTGRRVFRH